MREHIAFPGQDSLRPSAMRKGRQLDREAALHTSGFAVGLKHKQEQGAPGLLHLAKHLRIVARLRWHEGTRFTTPHEC